MPFAYPVSQFTSTKILMPYVGLLGLYMMKRIHPLNFIIDLFKQISFAGIKQGSKLEAAR